MVGKYYLLTFDSGIVYIGVVVVWFCGIIEKEVFRMDCWTIGVLVFGLISASVVLWLWGRKILGLEGKLDDVNKRLLERTQERDDVRDILLAQFGECCIYNGDLRALARVVIDKHRQTLGYLENARLCLRDIEEKKNIEEQNLKYPKSYKLNRGQRVRVMDKDLWFDNISSNGMSWFFRGFGDTGHACSRVGVPLSVLEAILCIYNSDSTPV